MHDLELVARRHRASTHDGRRVHPSAVIRSAPPRAARWLPWRLLHTQSFNEIPLAKLRLHLVDSSPCLCPSLDGHGRRVYPSRVSAAHLPRARSVTKDPTGIYCWHLREIESEPLRVAFVSCGLRGRDSVGSIWWRTIRWDLAQADALVQRDRCSMVQAVAGATSWTIRPNGSAHGSLSNRTKTKKTIGDDTSGLFRFVRP
jgi:hypothetical protein